MPSEDHDSRNPAHRAEGGAAPGCDVDPRRPYRPPRLECYGDVTDLVRQFGGGPLSDAGNNRVAPVTPPS